MLQLTAVKQSQLNLLSIERKKSLIHLHSTLEHIFRMHYKFLENVSYNLQDATSQYLYFSLTFSLLIFPVQFKVFQSTRGLPWISLAEIL